MIIDELILTPPPISTFEIQGTGKRFKSCKQEKGLLLIA